MHCELVLAHFCFAEICRQQVDGHMHSMMLNSSEWKSNHSSVRHMSVKTSSSYVEQSTTSRPGIDDVIASAEPMALLPTASTSTAESIAHLIHLFLKSAISYNKMHGVKLVNTMIHEI